MDPQQTPQPLSNPKYRHISRSAAKRESVQLLGSIQHLRSQFSGVSVSHRPGTGAGVHGRGSLGSLGEDDEDDTGSERAEVGKAQERRPYKEVELPRVDPEAARKEAQAIVTSIREIWGLSLPVSTHSPNSLPSSRSLFFPPNLVPEGEGELRSSNDIQSALVTTARSIRRIRFLSLSISQHKSAVPGLPTTASSKVRQSFSTPSRPSIPLRVVSNPSPTARKVSDGKQDRDVLYDLRKSALEVLTALRALEEKLKVEMPEYINENSRSHSVTPSVGESTITGSALSSEPEYDPEYDSDSYNLNALAQEGDSNGVSLTWEERITREEREYRALEAHEWEKEARATREGVGKWVGVVEKLFIVSGKGRDDGKIEDWVMDEEWEGNILGRLHSFLLSQLPLELALRLPPPQSDDFSGNFLSVLSDAYILIQAYNSALLSSSKPWGLIPADDVHPTLASSSGEDEVPTSDEGKKDKEWTFRRVGNLTCFAAALKHRYQLPIYMPSNTSASSFLPKPVALPHPGRNDRASSLPRSTAPLPSHRSSPVPDAPARTDSPNGQGRGGKPQTRDAPRIDFDPMTIAKKAEGWEEMLQGVVAKWVEGVSREVREVVEARETRLADVVRLKRPEKRGGMI